MSSDDITVGAAPELSVGLIPALHFEAGVGPVVGNRTWGVGVMPYLQFVDTNLLGGWLHSPASYAEVGGKLFFDYGPFARIGGLFARRFENRPDGQPEQKDWMTGVDLSVRPWSFVCLDPRVDYCHGLSKSWAIRLGVTTNVSDDPFTSWAVTLGFGVAESGLDPKRVVRDE